MRHEKARYEAAKNLENSKRADRDGKRTGTKKRFGYSEL